MKSCHLRFLALLLTMVMLFGLLAGCGSGSQDSGTQQQTTSQQQDINVSAADLQQAADTDTTKTYKKKIVIGSANPMTNPDPQAIYDNAHNTIENLVYNQLVSYNFDTREVEPELAVEWKAEDPQTYWFKLREGVKFSNGEELTADDVRYTFMDRVSVTGGTAQPSVFPTIEDVEILGDYELRIHLNTADADFLNRMYIQSFAICNKDACEADPENGFKIGTGGWILTEFIASDHATYKRFDDSWVWKENGLNPTEELEYRYIPEASTRTAALEAGDIAASGNISLSEYDILAGNDNIDVTLFAAEVLDYLIINMKNGIAADDDNLRMAIAYALDIDEANAYSQDGLATRAYTIWGMSQYGYFDDFDEKLEFNLDKAKEYLAKSKHPNGCDFNIYVTNNYESMATLLQAQLKKINVNVIVHVTDKAGMTEVVKAGEHDAIFMSISLQSIGDRFHFVCNPKSSTNRALYENPEMLDKFNAALAETDDAARKQIYKEIQIELNDVKAYIPYFYEVLCVGNNKNVTGIKWSPDSKPDFTYIRWAE